MSRAISNDLKTHLGEGLTTIATCWAITRQDGLEYFFTDHDVDLVVAGDTYEASSGMRASSVVQSRSLAPDNVDVFAVLDSDNVSEGDLLAGKFDGASVDVFIVNWDDLAMGTMSVLSGWTMGQVQVRDQAFRSELRSKGELLAQSIVDVYCPTCRAIFGDAQCGIDASVAHTETGSATSVASRRTFTDSSRTETEDVFSSGLITWTTSGSENDGLQMEVKAYDVGTKTFTLLEQMPFDIGTGDAYEATWGCDKARMTCINRYNNIANFRGEPFVPGKDSIPVQRTRDAHLWNR